MSVADASPEAILFWMLRMTLPAGCPAPAWGAAAGERGGVSGWRLQKEHASAGRRSSACLAARLGGARARAALRGCRARRRAVHAQRGRLPEHLSFEVCKQGIAPKTPPGPPRPDKRTQTIRCFDVRRSGAQAGRSKTFGFSTLGWAPLRSALRLAPRPSRLAHKTRGRELAAYLSKWPPSPLLSRA